MSPEMAEAFEAYKKYLALKSHFTNPKYDYFKYQGRVKATPDTFETRKDKYFFYKLSKQKNLEQYLVASFVDLGPSQWIGDLMENMKVNNTYAKWLKRQESITYHYKNELIGLDDDYNKNFEVIDGQHPSLLKKYLQKDVCIETVIILDTITPFIKYWNKNIDDRVVWPEVRNKIDKYKPFVRFNNEKCRQLTIDRFINNKQ
jgi:hypothetical protein